MESDATANIIAAAALAVVVWSISSCIDLKAKLDTCQTEFRSFKEGVVYGK